MKYSHLNLFLERSIGFYFTCTSFTSTYFPSVSALFRSTIKFYYNQSKQYIPHDEKELIQYDNESYRYLNPIYFCGNNHLISDSKQDCRSLILQVKKETSSCCSVSVIINGSLTKEVTNSDNLAKCDQSKLTLLYGTFLIEVPYQSRI